MELKSRKRKIFWYFHVELETGRIKLFRKFYRLAIQSKKLYLSIACMTNKVTRHQILNAHNTINTQTNKTFIFSVSYRSVQGRGSS